MSSPDFPSTAAGSCSIDVPCSSQTAHPARCLLYESMVPRECSKEELFRVSEEGPLLVLFLRHLGCTFAREAVADVLEFQAEGERQGVRFALVTMSPIESLLERAQHPKLLLISDPARALYQEFGVGLGSLRQILGLRSLLRGLKAAFWGGYGFGRIEGDCRQMPAVIGLKDGRIATSFIHSQSGDRPCYRALTHELLQA